MTLNKYRLVSGAIALSLLAATPALADSVNAKDGLGEHGGFNLKSLVGFFDHAEKGDGSAKDSTSSDRMKTDGTVVAAGRLTAVSGTTLTLLGKDGAVYTVNASGAAFNKVGLNSESTITIADLKIGDTIVAKGTLSGSTIIATKVVDGTLIKKDFLAHVDSVRVGVVTAVNGTTLTLSGKKGTTTVTTDANTKVFVNGVATTSGAATVGSKVVVAGTTTASSTSGTTIAAQFVGIFTRGFGFLKHLFHR